VLQHAKLSQRRRMMVVQTTMLAGLRDVYAARHDDTRRKPLGGRLAVLRGTGAVRWMRWGEHVRVAAFGLCLLLEFTAGAPPSRWKLAPRSASREIYITLFSAQGIGRRKKTGHSVELLGGIR
jgi:hypothetical protein